MSKCRVHWGTDMILFDGTERCPCCFKPTASYEEERIRPEIRALVARGNVTPVELLETRCNSWEWEALVPVMNDEAFCERMQYTLDNCMTPRERPYSTYNQALEGLWAPELLKRFGKYRAVVEFLRGSIPLAETPEEFFKELEEIQRLSIATKSCQACRIEAEIGTEEEPHPVPSRFHTCLK